MELRSRALAASVALLVIVGGAAAGIVVTHLAATVGRTGPLVVMGTAAAVGIGVLVWRTPTIGAVAVFTSLLVPLVSIGVGPVVLQPIDLAVTAFAAVLVVSHLAGGPVLRWPAALAWMTALLCWIAITLPFAADPGVAVKQAFSLTAGVVFAVALASACRTDDEVRRVLGGLVLVASAIAVLSLSSAGQIDATLGGTQVEGRAVGTFDHPNQLGSITAMTSVLALGLAVGSRTRWGRGAATFGVLILWCGLALSLSRGAWLGTAVAVAVLFVGNPTARRRILTILVPIAALVALTSASPVFDVVRERIGVIVEPSPYDARPAIWAEALRQIEEAPITGHGAGNYPVAAQAGRSRTLGLEPFHAHNLLLTWTAELGVPGSVLILSFVGALVLRVRGVRRRLARSDPRRVLVGAMGAALVALSVQGVVDYTLRNAAVWFTMWGTIGCLLAVTATHGSGSTPGSSRSALPQLHVVDERGPVGT